MSAEIFDVFAPTGKKRTTSRGISERRRSKTVGFVWDFVQRGDEMWEALKPALLEAEPSLRLIDHDAFGNVHGHDEAAVVSALPERLREAGVDLAVVGMGACGSCTPAVVRATVVAEQAGVPAVAMVASGFVRQARAVARGLGMPGMAIVEYPGVPVADSVEVLGEKVRSQMLPQVLEHVRAELSQDGTSTGARAEAADAEDAAVDRVVFSGSLGEVQEEFIRRQWSDGLPVVPPTRERVERFLAFADRDPGEVLGVLVPEHREVTVWNVAVTGVMAGCRPEYMPILVAAAEAVADPGFGLEHAGSTPGWEPIVVVAGPLADELAFNSRTGVLRVGPQANTSVGRFLRLLLRNIAGLRPGELDKGSIGLGFNVAVAENASAVTELGWAPYQVDRGFAADDTVVTVQSVVAVSMPLYCAGSTAAERLDALTYGVDRAIDVWCTWGIWFHHLHPLIIMSPDIARTLAANGVSKDDVRRHLFEQLRIPAQRLERYSAHAAGSARRLTDLVADGTADPVYAESDDPDRLVPMLQRAEWTDILLAGDPDRSQAKVLVNSHEQGVPISRRAVPVAGWQSRTVS